MISHCVIAVTVAMRSGCPARHPSPELSCPKDGDDRFFPLLGNNGHLQLAFLNEKNSVRRVSLCEDKLIRSIFGDGPSPAYLGEKGSRIEFCLFFALFQTGSP